MRPITPHGASASDPSRHAACRRKFPGTYLILAPVGAGGMGEVYRARDPGLGRDVAMLEGETLRALVERGPLPAERGPRTSGSSSWPASPQP